MTFVRSSYPTNHILSSLCLCDWGTFIRAFFLISSPAHLINSLEYSSEFCKTALRKETGIMHHTMSTRDQMFPATVGVARYHFFGHRLVWSVPFVVSSSSTLAQTPPEWTSAPIILAGTVKLFHGKEQRYRPKPNSVWGKREVGWMRRTMARWSSHQYGRHCGRYPPATCATKSFP